MRYIFIVPARLGDAVMTTPALALLATQAEKITVIAASALGASVYKNNPHVAAIFVAPLIKDWQMLLESHDQVVLSHNDAKTLAIARQLDLLPMTILTKFTHDAPQAAQQLSFIATRILNKTHFDESINYQLFPDASDKEKISQLLGAIDGPLVGMHLGCHGIAKKKRWRRLWHKRTHRKVWPLKSFIRLSKLIQKKSPTTHIIVTGSPNERHLAAKFCRRCKNAINLCGETDTQGLAALMTRLAVFVSSDTGAMHVACAMSVPVLALFGPTNVALTGPYPKTPCRHVLQAAEMDDITPAAVMKLLACYISFT